MAKILKLVMRGFKSFATKTELVLGDKFNVVLGPNGSGKSNVLDALCFVLGKGRLIISVINSTCDDGPVWITIKEVNYHFHAHTWNK